MDSAEILFTAIKVAVVVAVFFSFDRVIAWLIDVSGEKKKLEKSAIRQIKTSIRYFVIGFAILGILAALGIDLAIVFAGAGILVFAISFAAKDIIANYIAGIFMIFEKNLSVGDIVKVADTYGIVKLVALRTTQIKTFDDNLIIAPNTKIVNSIIFNMTAGSDFMLTSIAIKIGYNEDLNKVMKIMVNSIPEDPRIHITEESDVRFEVQEIDDARILGNRVIMYFRVEAEQEPWIRSKVHAQVVKALVENKIQFQQAAGSKTIDED